MTWPLARRSHARRGMGPWRLRAQHVDPRLGLRAAARASCSGDYLAPAELLQREHLSSRTADARVFGAPRPAGDADPSDLRAHEKSDPLLQPAVPLDVRAVGSRHVSVRARADRQHAAAFVGGLLFAFAPYRIPQSSHLQVLSSQWMPFALYGFRRYFEGCRTRALVGGTAAAILQGLSCGYYLLYFSPFALAYVVWEMWRTRRWSDRRTWFALAAAAVAAVLITAPFVIPYIRVSRELELSRSLSETTRLSADVYSYATASAPERFWGNRLADVFPKREGELFPGLVPLLLALVGMASAVRPLGTHAPRTARTVIARLLWLVAVVHALAATATIAFRRLTFDLWLFDVRLGNVTQLLLRSAIAYGVASYLSPSMRARASAFMRSGGFFVLALVAAAWLSLGPSPQVLGRPLDLASPYGYLWTYVPGFEGLRVPARMAMIVALMLAVLGAVGAAAVVRIRYGTAVLAILAAFFSTRPVRPPLWSTACRRCRASRRLPRGWSRLGARRGSTAPSASSHPML